MVQIIIYTRTRVDCKCSSFHFALLRCPHSVAGRTARCMIWRPQHNARPQHTSLWYTHLPTYFTYLFKVYHVDIVVLSINWHKTHSIMDNIGLVSVQIVSFALSKLYILQKLVLWNCKINFTCLYATQRLQAVLHTHCIAIRDTIPQHVSFIPKADQLYNYCDIHSAQMWQPLMN